MSEYQYYEFQAIDRALSAEEQKDVSGLSSRVQLSPFRAVFTYSYGDFRGDPEKLLARCFDALLHVANWGSRWLYFRFPGKLLDVQSLAQYCVDEFISVRKSGSHVILGITVNPEDGGCWSEAEGELGLMLPLRQQILDGDYRLLYLAWLKANEGAEDDDTLEPPVPPGLGDLSVPLKAFVEFVDIDADLIAVAAETSGDAPPEADLEPMLPLLPEAERDELLRQLLRDEPGLGLQLRRRLKEIRNSSTPSAATKPQATRRRLSELLASAKLRVDERKQKASRAAEAARLRKLEGLAKQEPAMWVSVAQLIAEKKTTAYDAAVLHLKSLSDLARHRDQLADFTLRVQAIQQKHPSLVGLRDRLQRAGLLAG